MAHCCASQDGIAQVKQVCCGCCCTYSMLWSHGPTTSYAIVHIGSTWVDCHKHLNCCWAQFSSVPLITMLQLITHAYSSIAPDQGLQDVGPNNLFVHLQQQCRVACRSDCIVAATPGGHVSSSVSMLDMPCCSTDGANHTNTTRLLTFCTLPIALGNVFEGDGCHLAHAQVHCALCRHAQQVHHLPLCALMLWATAAPAHSRVSATTTPILLQQVGQAPSLACLSTASAWQRMSLLSLRQPCSTLHSWLMSMMTKTESHAPAPLRGCPGQQCQSVGLLCRRRSKLQGSLDFDQRL